MRLLRQYHLLAFALVLLSVLGATVALRDVLMLMIAGGLAAMSWYVTEGPRGRSIPAWISNVLVLGVCANVAREVLLGETDLLGVLTRFVLWLTIIKLYERKEARDYAQLLLLSLLLMLAGSTASADLLFWVIVAVYLALGFYVLLLHQVFAANERQRGRARAESGRAGVGRMSLRPVTGRGVLAQFRWLTVASGVAALVIGGAMFIAIPRGVGERMLGGTVNLPGEMRTGFTDSIDLTASTRITESRRPVLRVRLNDRAGRPVRPGEPLYLRGAVLDVYQSRGRWQASGSLGTREVTIGAGPGSWTPLVTGPPGAELLGGFGGDGRPDDLVLEVRSLMRVDRLFSLLVPVAVETTVPTTLEYQQLGQEILAPGRTQQHEYRLLVRPRPSNRDLGDLVRRPKLTDTTQSRLRHPRIVHLARDLLEAAGMPPRPADTESTARFAWNRRAAGVFQDFLQSEAFTYDLDLSGIRIPDDIDPVEHFLTVTRRGHCEYFASAFAALCAAEGVPCRVISGYCTANYDPGDGSYLVLESDAHAWNEIRVGARRWETIDATPSAVIQQRTTEPGDLASQARNFYENLDAGFTRSIVEFDRRRQQRVATRISFGWDGRLADGIRSLRSWMERVNRAFRLGPSGYIWLGIVTLAVGIGLVAAFKLIRRSLRIARTLRLRGPGTPGAGRMRRQLAFYHDMLDVLGRGGLAKPSWQAPLLHARSLEDDRPEIGPLVERLTHLYYAGRYGGRALERAEQDEAESLLQSLAGALGVRVRRI